MLTKLLPADLEKITAATNQRLESYRLRLMLCAGTGCVSSKSFEVQVALQQELAKHNLQDEVAIIITGCNGFCAKGPVMVVQPDNIFYQLLTAEDIPELVETEKTGLLVPPGRPEKLAEAMLRMLKDEDLRSRIIPAARQRVVRNFDNKRLIGDLAAVYLKEIEDFRNVALTRAGSALYSENNKK